MKKSILAIAVAATMAAPAAMAAPTVYGNLHMTILDLDSMTDGPDLTSNTSAIGVKGSEDLGDGLKAIYKMEFQVDVTDSGATDGGTTGLVNRDQFAGLKGGMGTIKFGTMSSNYKQLGGKVDSLYRTPAEGRGFIHTQSRLHNGRATNRGRMTNAVQYASPKMGGVSLVANTTVSNSPDETAGIGVRYNSKAFMAYVDYIDTVPGGSSVSTNATESAVKVGGKFSSGAFFVGAQYEDAEDLTGYNYTHLNGGFSIDANNIITATYGTAAHINTSTMDTDGLAVAYIHTLSKMTMLYAAIVDKSSDTAALDDNGWALGFRKKF